MKKSDIKRFLKDRLRIFPEDIITSRPQGMSREAYGKERRRVDACLKDYLSHGQMFYTVSKGLYAKDPRTGRVFMYGIDTERTVEPGKRKLGVPYVNKDKQAKRAIELKKYSSDRMNKKRVKAFKDKRGLFLQK